MKDHDNLHLKMQELCTCFSNTDPLKEMSGLKDDSEGEEQALKWLALVALHGVGANAEKITLKQEGEEIRVQAEYRTHQLPAPGKNTAQEIFSALRKITHIEDKKGKTRLALGIQDSSVDLTVSIKEKEGKQKISIRFP
jgi:hypothetical protein